MRSDVSSLSTVQDALGLGAAVVDVGYTGLDEAKNIVTKIKDKLVAAAQPGLDRAKIQTEISELQAQLTGIASSATLQGQNWLSVDLERCRLQRHEEDRLLDQPQCRLRLGADDLHRHRVHGSVRRQCGSEWHPRLDA